MKSSIRTCEKFLSEKNIGDHSQLINLNDISLTFARFLISEQD